MPQRTRITPEQQLVMLQFLEQHPEMVGGRVKNPAAAKKVKMLWHILTKKLNDVEGGVRKTSTMWTKTWWDKKWFLKKMLLQHDLEKEERGINSRVQWAPLDVRVFHLLLQSGEVTEAEIDSAAASAKNIIVKTEEAINTSLSHRLSTTTENGDENVYSEYLGSSIRINSDFDANMDRYVRPKYSSIIRNSNRHLTSEPDLQTEFNRVAFFEEKRLKVKQIRCKAREDVAEAMNRCSSAMEALAGAVNYQGTMISNALRAQRELIAEGLKLQGEMIA